MTSEQAMRGLGMNAKSTSARSDAKPAAGSIHSVSAMRKWALQRAAQQIMSDKRPRTDRFGNEREHYKYRVAMCQRGTDGMAPEIRRSECGERAEFYGVQTCGSVWLCPICAGKIANRRRDQMREGMAKHRDNGGMVFLATFTFQHTALEGGAGGLKDQLAKLRKAYSSFQGHRAIRSTYEAAGSIGAVRAMEVTYADINGWHPHIHQLVFADKDALVTDQRHGHIGHTVYRRSTLGRLRQAWARHLIKHDMAGIKAGDTGAERFGKLRHLLRRCFTVQCGSYADDYISKFGREGEEAHWGMADELAKSHVKTGRRTAHLSPWGLLAQFLEGDKAARWLFREYAEAFHGKRQLVWSKGLAEKLGVELGEDEEIAAAPEVRCTETVIRLDDDQWRVILSRNARWEVLRAAAKFGRLGVNALLQELREVPAKWSDAYESNGQAFAPMKYA